MRWCCIFNFSLWVQVSIYRWLNMRWCGIFSFSGLCFSFWVIGFIIWIESNIQVLTKRVILVDSFPLSRKLLVVRGVFKKGKINAKNVWCIVKSYHLYHFWVGEYPMKTHLITLVSSLDRLMKWWWTKAVHLNSLRDKIDWRWDVSKTVCNFWSGVSKKRIWLGIRLIRCVAVKMTSL